jgi:hypothetical protein
VLLVADLPTRWALLGAVVNTMTMSELVQVRHMLDRNALRWVRSCLAE